MLEAYKILGEGQLGWDLWNALGSLLIHKRPRDIGRAWLRGDLEKLARFENLKISKVFFKTA